jgi:hypothetical protein
LKPFSRLFCREFRQSCPAYQAKLIYSAGHCTTFFYPAKYHSRRETGVVYAIPDSRFLSPNSAIWENFNDYTDYSESIGWEKPIMGVRNPIRGKIMTRFLPPAFCFLTLIGISTLLVGALPLFAADRHGPVFPDAPATDDETGDSDSDDIVAPLPPPRRNPLLERPKNKQAVSKQVVFNDLDPVSDVIPQRFIDDEESAAGLLQTVRPKTKMPKVLEADNGEFMQKTIQSTENFTFDELPTDMNAFVSGPIVQTFGMGLFDNLTLFSEVTSFKTELNNGAGSAGLGEGINWSTPVTPQGTITAQYGVRAVQSDNFSRSARSQCFMTAGIFKRLENHSLQGGVAVDWLHDHSSLGTVDLRQMRCEISARSFKNLEYGFMGGFDVFKDRPTTPKIDNIAVLERHLSTLGGAADMLDYYLLFVRKPLDSGGQIEFRLGSTERGDLILGGLGEAAITDRLAVNGGFTMLAPSEGHSISGNQRENWSMSLGIVLYFRGGAVCKPTNLYRPMFDVAGNNTMFSRIVGK